MPNPIGVTFIPTAANQAQGPQQYATEGGIGGSNLEQAFKILSLQLPTALGTHAITPLSPTPGGLHPQAAIFQALIRAMLGGSGPMSLDTGGTPASDGVSSVYRDFLTSANANSLPTGSSAASSTPAPDVSRPGNPSVVFNQPRPYGADAPIPDGSEPQPSVSGALGGSNGLDRSVDRTRY